MNKSEQVQCEGVPIEEEQPEQQQQQICEEEEYIQEQEWQDDIYNEINELLPSRSKDKPYSIYHIEQLIRKVWEEVEGKALRCCMSPGWTLMLYLFANFNPNYFDDLIDAESTGRNIIKYREDYLKPDRKEGECPVCLTQGKLLANPCGHSFCQDCWKGHISLNYNDRNLYELFPLCQEEDCYHRTNYHLIQSLWVDDPQLRLSFSRLLCLKYSQKSIQVKLCPTQSCGKAIYFNLQNSIVESTAKCDCGTEVCRFCGAKGHWPLNCVDLRSWNGMISGTEDQWMNGLLLQKCPMCREPIEKNNGCIHMTCRCKYQFCWICLKVWKGHNSVSSCSDLSREDHEKKLKQEQAKRKLNENLYSERLEDARGQTDRLTLSIKRVSQASIQKLVKRLEEIQVLSIHSALLAEMREFVSKAWGLVYRTTIYIFFESQDALTLKRIIFRVNRAADQMDDYLSETLYKNFKELDEKIEHKIKKQEGGEKEFADAERIKLRLDFDKDREKYRFLMREGMKVLDLVKRGEIRQALQLVTNKNCPLYIETEPIGLVPIQQIPSQQDSSDLSHL